MCVCVCVCVWEGPESVCGLADLGSRGERDGCCNSGCSHPPIKLQMQLLSEEEGLGWEEGELVILSMHHK